MEGATEAVVTAEVQLQHEACNYGSNESSSDASGYDELNDLDCFGIEAVDRACLALYPEQPNPIQAEAVVKFW